MKKNIIDRQDHEQPSQPYPTLPIVHSQSNRFDHCDVGGNIFENILDAHSIHSEMPEIHQATPTLHT